MRCIRRRTFLAVLVLAGIAVSAEAQSRRQPSEWQRVDALSEGTAISVTFNTGNVRRYRFSGSDPQNLAVVSATGAKEVLLKSSIASIAASRDTGGAVGIGALAGAGALVAWLLGASALCGQGCENDMPSAAVLLIGGFGAGIGSLVGLAAAKTSGPPEVLFPPAATPPHHAEGRYPTLSLGVGTGHGAFRSYTVRGATSMRGVTVAALITLRISFQIEWTKPATSTFFSPRAALDDLVISGAEPTSSITRQEQHSVHLEPQVAGLVGVHPRRLGRLRLGVLTGLSLQSRQTTTLSPGKRSLDHYQGPGAGLVVGLDAEIALTSRLAVVPRVRYDTAFGSWSGVGISWRF